MAKRIDARVITVMVLLVSSAYPQIKLHKMSYPAKW